MSSALVSVASEGMNSNSNSSPPAVSVVDLSMALNQARDLQFSSMKVLVDQAPVVVGILIPPLSFAKERDIGSSRGAFPS